jgi:hypothetical protein
LLINRCDSHFSIQISISVSGLFSLQPNIKK